MGGERYVQVARPHPKPRIRPRLRKALTAAAITIAVLAAVAGFTVLQEHSARAGHNDYLVRTYCEEGAVSTAEARGCEKHVTAAYVNQMAAHGDQTAIDAENSCRTPRIKRPTRSGPSSVSQV